MRCKTEQGKGSLPVSPLAKVPGYWSHHAAFIDTAGVLHRQDEINDHRPVVALRPLAHRIRLTVAPIWRRFPDDGGASTIFSAGGYPAHPLENRHAILARETGTIGLLVD
jgi:hypothetical protein